MPIRERQQWFLRAWRKQRELSQTKLAERVNHLHGTSLHKGDISNYETGERRYNQDVIEMFADALGIEPSDLLRDPNKPDPPRQIWERILPEKRADALRVLEAFVEPELNPKKKKA